MESEYDILIAPDGTISFIYSDALAAVFEGEPMETTRASHVEPASAYGIAPWGWVADMRPSGGPILVATGELHGALPFSFLAEPDPAVIPFLRREDALDAERAWLRKERQL